MSLVEEFFKYVSEVEILKGLPKDKIMALLGHSYDKSYAKGDYLFKEGSSSDKIFLILEGGVKVESNGTFLAHMGEKDVVGEMGVFTRQTRSADVIASEDTKALVLPSEKVFSFIDENKEAGLIIYRNVVNILARHLKEKNFIMELNKLMDEADF